MTRRIYQNGFENGNIVPIGRSNASSFPKAPNNERNRFIKSFSICTLGAMELQKIANESIQRKRKKNAKDFLNFLNENF